MPTTERPKSSVSLPLRKTKHTEQPVQDEYEDDRDTWVRFLEERELAGRNEAVEPRDETIADADSQPPLSDDSKRVARGSIPPPTDKVEAQIIAEEEEVLKRYFDFAAEIDRDTSFED